MLRRPRLPVEEAIDAPSVDLDGDRGGDRGGESLLVDLGGIEGPSTELTAYLFMVFVIAGRAV